MRPIGFSHTRRLVAAVLLQIADQATGINSTTPRPDVGGDWPEGDLPEQMGGARTTLMPGISVFVLPANLAQLWHEVEIEDNRPTLANGSPNPTFKTKVKRQQLKLDRANPLVVVGGTRDGEPMTATFTSNPRPRGKKDDPKTPWISDLAYLLEISLADKSRPATVDALKAQITRYAGKTIRIEHGLTAQCRGDKVRYILVATAEGESTMQDPAGTKGCGARYYTKDFKNPGAAAGQSPYDSEIQCDCGAVLRGFEQVERFLPPLGK